jgi:Na+/H+-dicarboxylate symporter
MRLKLHWQILIGLALGMLVSLISPSIDSSSEEGYN